MLKQALAIALLLALTAAGNKATGQVYKWTDEDGNVHFSDTPVDQDAERVPIQSRRTDPARVQASVQARQDAAAKAAEEEAAAAAENPGPTADELQARAEERAQKCTTYRERLQRLVQSRRIYRMDESGERVYMNEEEMQKARQDAEDLVQQYCDT